MGEIKQERCLGSEGRLDGGVYAWLCVWVCARACVRMDVAFPLALCDGTVR